MKIPLTQGLFALIDKTDAHLILPFKWHASKGGNTFYAMRHGKTIKGKRPYIKMHSLIIRLKTGEITDHINGNGLDNRRTNLRRCTNKENVRNQHARRGVSKYKGVGFHKVVKKWRAYITVNQIHISLGYFIDEIKAAQAYNEAALQHFGEYANLNVI